MQALVRQGGHVTLAQVPEPQICNPGDVAVDVAVAGLCRTDVYVAEGRIPCADARILGHEFAGTVAGVGKAVHGLAIGDRVAVFPAIPCGTCPECHAPRRSGAICAAYQMLGIDRDGAFARSVVVPASVVHPLPAGVPWEVGAYAEPVAAALGILQTGLDPRDKVLIYGQGRFAMLAAAVLRHHGFRDVSIGDACDSSSYDFVIETGATARTLAAALDAVRPGGTIVLKSRTPDPVPLDFLTLTRKQVTLRAVSYGSFADAVAMLSGGGLPWADLLGETYPLARYADVFAWARESEGRKMFFRIGETA